jgi:hypothetical protein
VAALVYSGHGVTARSLSLLFLAFLAAGFALYAPALRGAFLGDDFGYVVHNFYIQSLDLRGVLALLDPFGAPARYTANYAPVGLAVHALEWRLFGEAPLGYHAVNVALHALASTLLVAVYARSGIPALAAAVLGALFLVHPANVEAVAWIFQLKTVLALALAAGALLAFPARPLAAWLLFSLALLTKFQAAFALPVAVAWELARRGPAPARRALWLGAWAASALLCALPEFLAFSDMGHTARLGRYPTAGLHALDLLAIAGRYLALAATSFGVSTFHEPPPARSWIDPWALFGLAACLGLGLRLGATLRARSGEAAFWIWAAAAYAPVSQVFPFLYPMGDRYLYFVLPGLLGGGYLALRGSLARAPRLRIAALAAACSLAALFAVHAAARARVWRSELTATLDAARHYPDGTAATYLGARRAAQAGDLPGALAALERLADRGFDSFLTLQSDAGFAPLQGDPRFEALVRRTAGSWIEHVAHREALTQPELRMLALAHRVRGEEREAVARYREALAVGGPLDETVRQELRSLEPIPVAP